MPGLVRRHGRGRKVTDSPTRLFLIDDVIFVGGMALALVNTVLQRRSSA